ncbi:OmpA-OmpF porin, OOP family [Amycolatopsis mediterranei S699]|uniref:OmpA-OmpF porin, OOP family n=2 Tax=Amycolatopsis mediterranei TaxID=33910 RepID=A0A0H3DA65_AMYMU|nr:OmpA family protein [Amycolatopsis mediterranei]ADJ47536.1 OmpA-OmpF porin, OOP family [Amycolatopsis mediterranei U32]AEK44401.1 OmpA-OmpF porin, OOP family protein [Amycolatopsis mediterranei S699]AFO79247.1 OmpA-OmpF porin, OOP family [Amycolatopsis mediterranei S699]AGT86375.1 OmpA-OmpF porin, OOP family [Amycolatopsis mediterranei RB]KDO12824.1 cell envelope biogenesis protein OmpA [Amycolatopsis mediterranei]
MRVLIAGVFVGCPMAISAACGVDEPTCDETLPAYQAAAPDPGDPDSRLEVLVDHTADAPRIKMPAELGEKLHDMLDAHTGGGRVLIDVGQIQGRSDGAAFWKQTNRVARYRTDVDADRDGYVRRVLGCLDAWTSSLVPQQPDSSLLDALQKVSRQIGTEHGPVSVVAVSNGLDNTAPLDLRVPLAGDATPESVAKMLAGDAEIPGLQGVDVQILELGQTSQGRRQMTEGEQRWIVSVWGEILKAAGVAKPRLERKSGDILDGAPANVPADAVFAAAPPQPKPPVGTGSVSLSAQALFDPNSPVLAPAAEAVLRPYVTILQGPGAHATITGHTATWGPIPGRDLLSVQRAEAVRNYFIEQHVPAEALAPARGVGSSEQVVNDIDPAGNLIEQAAQRNRRIVLDIVTPTKGR